MENEDGKRSSSDESRISDQSAQEEQKIMLEEEIKKIISGLDVKYEDSAPEEEVLTVVPSALPTGSSKMVSSDRHEIESPHTRESTCPSAATTVVNQRVPPKISVNHLKSEIPGWNTQQQPQSTRSHGAQYDSGNYARECGFYQPERDEVTEPTLTETLPSTTENTTTNTFGTSTSPHPNRAGWLPPVREESVNCVAQCQANHEPPNLPNYSDPSHATLRNFTPMTNNHLYGNPSNYPTEIINLPQYQSSYQPECIPQEYHSGYPGAPTPSQPVVHQKMQEKVDRYNSTHMTYAPLKEQERPRRSITDYLMEKGRNMFTRRDDSDSGEIIPQLYKARVKNGTTPQRFTFKAVTGAPYCGCNQCKSAYCQPSYTIPPSSKSAMECRPPPALAPMYELPPEPCSCFPPNLQEAPTRGNKSCGKNCGVATSYKEDIKTKAYYTDLGCGYISQNSVPEKVDIYCFDQLNTGFFRTSDHPPPLFTDIAIQRTERYATVFWAEIFGIVNIFTAFVIAMFLQTFKFVLQGILRPILIGFVQLLSDYLIKPLLTLLYNGFTQPISIFLYNVIASMRDIMQPMAKGLGYFVELVAVVLRAIRLVEVKNVTNISPCGPQSVKY